MTQPPHEPHPLFGDGAGPPGETPEQRAAGSRRKRNVAAARSAVRISRTPPGNSATSPRAAEVVVATAGPAADPGGPAVDRAAVAEAAEAATAGAAAAAAATGTAAIGTAVEAAGAAAVAEAAAETATVVATRA